LYKKFILTTFDKIKIMYLQLEEDNIFLGRNKNKPKKEKKNLAKKILLAPGRALFIAMNQINFGQIATKLSRGNQDQLKSQWLKLGGDYNKLVNAINKGKNKKAKGNDFFKKILGKKQLNEHENCLAENLYINDNFGLAEDPEENPGGLSKEAKAKIIGIATGAAGAIGTAVGLPAVAAAGPALAAVIIGIIPLLSKADEIPDAENPQGPEVPTDPTQETDNASEAAPGLTPLVGGTRPGAIFSTKNLPYFLGGAVILGIGAFFLFRKKK
jgi:LPXTG-motif cell wall-anchored protein